MRVSLSWGVGTGQLARQSSAPPKQVAWGLSSTPLRPPEPLLAVWAGLKQASPQPPGKGSSRLGRQVTLPCVGQCPSCQLTGSTATGCPGLARSLRALTGVGGQL